MFAPRRRPRVATGLLTFEQILASLPEPNVGKSHREGYYRAAVVLAGCWSAPGYVDLYFPMLYCFRHYVELSLKSLIQAYASLAGREPRVKRGHGLAGLWGEAKRLLNLSDPENSSGEDLVVVERIINELNDIDPDSQLFRYADPKGKPTGERLREVNGEQFIATMEDLREFFEGCLCQAAEWSEWDAQERP